MIPENFCIFRRINNGINQCIETVRRLNCSCISNFLLIKRRSAQQMLEIQLNPAIRRDFIEISRLVQFACSEAPNKFASTKTSISELCFQCSAPFIVHHMRITQHLSVSSLDTLTQSLPIGRRKTIKRHPIRTFSMISRSYRYL